MIKRLSIKIVVESIYHWDMRREVSSSYLTVQRVFLPFSLKTGKGVFSIFGGLIGEMSFLPTQTLPPISQHIEDPRYIATYLLLLPIQFWR